MTRSHKPDSTLKPVNIPAVDINLPTVDMQQQQILPPCHDPVPVTADGSIPVVDSYIYLGALIHCSLDDYHEILRRTQKAYSYFGMLRPQLLGNRHTHRSTKKLVYEGMVMAVMLYGAETWIVRKNSELLLQSTHRRMVRAMSGVNRFTTRKFSITAVDLEKRLRLRSMRDYLDARILGFAGHAARMPPSRWPRLMLNCRCAAPRPIGAPQLTFKRQLRTILERKRLRDPNSWRISAQNRYNWRQFIAVPSPAFRKPEHVFSGQRVHFDRSAVSGTILAHTIRESCPVWLVALDTGDIAFLDRKIIAKNVVPPRDQLEWATEILKNPSCVLGRSVRREFSGEIFNGKIYDTDTDLHGRQIWGVEFYDGDSGDYHADEIVSMLTRLHRPPPLLGARVRKNFKNTAYNGTVIDFDVETNTRIPIWRILYDDNDFEDYNMFELATAVYNYTTTSNLYVYTKTDCDNNALLPLLVPNLTVL